MAGVTEKPSILGTIKSALGFGGKQVANKTDAAVSKALKGTPKKAKTKAPVEKRLGNKYVMEEQQWYKDGLKAARDKKVKASFAGSR